MSFERFRNVFFLLLRHGGVSVASATIELVLFSLLQGHLPLFVAYIIPFSIATTFGYIGHSYLTFRVGTMSLSTAGKFLIQICLSVAMGYYIVRFLIDGGMAPEVAKAIQLFVGFFFNVSFGRFVSFR